MVENLFDLVCGFVVCCDCYDFCCFVGFFGEGVFVLGDDGGVFLVGV